MNKTKKEFEEITLKVNSFLNEQLSNLPSTKNLLNPKFIFSRNPFACLEETTNPFMEYKGEFDEKAKVLLSDEKSYAKYVVISSISELNKRQNIINVINILVIIIYLILLLISFLVLTNFKIYYLLNSALIFAILVVNVSMFCTYGSLKHKFQIIQIFLED